MQKHILLSVKPCYSEDIYNGIKTVEYRNKIADFSSREISKKIYIYASKPVMAITGYFIAEEEFSGDIDFIAKAVNASKERRQRMKDYFTDHSSCNALRIGESFRFSETIELSKIRELTNNSRYMPPQNYRYLDMGSKLLEAIWEIENR